MVVNSTGTLNSREVGACNVHDIRCSTLQRLLCASPANPRSSSIGSRASNWAKFLIMHLPLTSCHSYFANISRLPTFFEEQTGNFRFLFGKMMSHPTTWWGVYSSKEFSRPVAIKSERTIIVVARPGEKHKACTLGAERGRDGHCW